VEMQLIYDGVALKNNEMDCNELSIALFSINELLKQSNILINKDNATIKVKVKASFETGCFKVNFTVAQNILDVAKNFLSSDFASNVLTAKSLFYLLFGTGGLVGLLKFLKGCNPDKIIDDKDNNFKVYKGEKYLKVENRLKI
jgi:hypothetical protein